jgi:CO/xanthine dehydrogenase Mo-binding subunit
MKRRDFLKTGGALVISFTVPLQSVFAQPKPDPRFLTAGAWLEIAPDGKVTFYTGKVELGTGVETALAQLVAEELDVPLSNIRMVMGDTELCPDQIGTFGSLTIFLAGPQVRQAAAEARLALLDLAAQKLKQENLRTENGEVIAPDGKRISYGELVEGKRLERPLSNKAKLKEPAQFKVVGKSAQRKDLPAKVFGTHTYIQNVRIPGMFHGRVIRPPVHGAAPVHVDDSALKKLPGHPQVVRQGNFLAVVADREEQAIRAAQALKVEWGAAPVWPHPQELPQVLKRISATDKIVDSGGDVSKAMSAAAKSHAAQYYVPYQLHASIGPSCAIADVKADRATLWSPTQTSFLTRDSVAAILKMPASRVRLIWVEGAGCYGQNGADDVTGDAALLSQLIGQPVRVQWMRRDEHCCEPKGPPMVMAVKGGLDAEGNVVAWDYEVWSPNHAGRPFAGMGGNLLAGEELGMPQRYLQAGADRNAKHSYTFANNRVVLHQLKDTPLRSSSLRGLGSPQNTFANESFMDELAALAGADPIEFRIRHLKDERAIAVLQEVSRMMDWQKRPRPSRSGVGRGVAFAHYDNYSAYAAVAVQVRVDQAGKTRVDKAWVAHDCGMIVNPDGVKLQIEGNIIQTVSRALNEEVRFNRRGIESMDWASYPILRFSEVPDEIAISLIDRPSMRAVGAGEPAAAPVFAAVANAIYDATGARMRDVPFTPERLKAAKTT